MGDVVMFLDTQNQNTWVGQLSVLQTLRGFPIPGKDADDKWKKYVGKNNYEWCSAKSVTVVMPWFRPCQQERSSRWVVCDNPQGSDGSSGGSCAIKECTECGEKESKDECTATSCPDTIGAFKKGGKCHLQNSCDSGKYIDVPTAQTMLRLINAPRPEKEDMGSSDIEKTIQNCGDGALPPGHLKVLVVEAHEEGPINALHSRNVGAKSVLYLGHLLKEDFSESISGGKLNIVFPDKGALHRYTAEAVNKDVKEENLFFLKKDRVGEKTDTLPRIYQLKGGAEVKVGDDPNFSKDNFGENKFLVVDDFTNSGGTSLAALQILRAHGGKDITIFVSHFVAAYKPEMAVGLLKKLKGLNEQSAVDFKEQAKCSNWTEKTIDDKTFLEEKTFCGIDSSPQVNAVQMITTNSVSLITESEEVQKFITGAKPILKVKSLGNFLADKIEELDKENGWWK